MRHKGKFLVVVLLGCGVFVNACWAGARKPDAEQALAQLVAGNQRFVEGKAAHPNSDPVRLKLCAESSQADYAFATVLSCSDSRVPVERLFDAGVMDLFIARVAGNISDPSQIGSIEYGLAHVHTPLLVVLGHAQCGAVTAVVGAMDGHGHALERNIPGVLDNIQPAVQRARSATAGQAKEQLLARAIEENVWQSMEDLYLASPATRELVKAGRVKVVGALYDLETGKVDWLSQDKPLEILARVEQCPERALNPLVEAVPESSHEPASQPITVH